MTEPQAWYVFYERDNQYAISILRPLDNRELEREVSVRKVLASSEEEAILTALSKSYGLASDDWRVWAIPASEVRPRPFSIKQRTEYDPVLGPPFIR